MDDWNVFSSTRIAGIVMKEVHRNCSFTRYKHSAREEYTTSTKLVILW